MEEVSMESADKYLAMAKDLAYEYGLKVLIALVVLWIGLRIIKTVVNQIDKAFARRGVDETLRPFLKALFSWALKLALILSVISIVGIETTSFIAILGAAGLAVGLALQGTLANFASGVMLLIFRPFKVGDYVEAGGEAGSVEEINIFVTKLRTVNNRLIIVPNSQVGSGSIRNYSAAETVRADLNIGISYGSNIKQAREVLLQTVQSDERVLKDPAVDVFVTNLGDSSVDLQVRFWVKTGDYWPAFFHNLEECKVALDNAGIEIPFPQTDVHLYQK